MAKTICFFNNKGGVGKTTMSCNIAAGMSQKFQKRVLFLDLDPQCNSTLLILGEEKIAKTYWESEEQINTILNIVDPLLVDEPSINVDKQNITRTDNRFGVDIVLGHPKLSMIEDRLGEAWGKVPGGDIGALRKTNWCHSLVKAYEQEYDYVLIDLGPSLGSLNRSALIASDYFITPMAIDVFSLIGLRNISEWLDSWINRYERGIDNLLSGPQSGIAGNYDIKTLLDIKTGYIGYTTQSYISKTTSDGTKRPTAAFEKIRKKFDEDFTGYLGRYKKPNVAYENIVLGEIPNMFSLAPLAQHSSAPIRDLKNSDGIFGAHYSQAARFSDLFDKMSEKVIANSEA